MLKLADGADSKSAVERRVGSTPTGRTIYAPVAKLAGARDLKSLAGDGVWVQVPSGVPRLYKLLLDSRIGKNYQEKFLINPLTNPKKFDIIKMFQRTAP